MFFFPTIVKQNVDISKRKTTRETKILHFAAKRRPELKPRAPEAPWKPFYFSRYVPPPLPDETSTSSYCQFVTWTRLIIFNFMTSVYFVICIIMGLCRLYSVLRPREHRSRIFTEHWGNVLPLKLYSSYTGFETFLAPKI